MSGSLLIRRNRYVDHTIKKVSITNPENHPCEHTFSSIHLQHNHRHVIKLFLTGYKGINVGVNCPDQLFRR